MSAGRDHTCAVRLDGHLVCFGRASERGECEVPPMLGPVLGVAAGIYHTCAVDGTGQLVCFGCDGHGQCEQALDMAAVF